MSERPFPPGEYPLVIVGSGPGGIQLSYDLRRLGVEHALLSRDEGPGGMFRRFPLFERLNTCSRAHAVVEREADAYYRFDWNSMLTDDPAHRACVAEFMDGTNYFPARHEMERGLTAFVERSGLPVRFGCTWESTARDDAGGFVLTTSDGEYRAPLLAFAVGMAEPWKPNTPGIEHVPHYADLEGRPLESFRGKSVFVIGKRNSGFEVADGLLHLARQLIVGSPHHARPSIVTGFPTPPRARYLEPLEDHLFGGGTFVVDVALDRIEPTGDGFRVHAQGTTEPGEMVFEVDEVVACTGFGTPMRDLPALGLKTFYKDRLPTLDAWWESTTLPGVYFAGAPSQAQAGMRKYGWPSRSASVGGFRYNAQVQAEHIAREHFGYQPPRPVVPREQLVDRLLEEATWGSGVWSQQSNLGRALSFADGEVRDDGLVPLAWFVDSTGPDAVAITVETDREENVQPAVYVRRDGHVSEHELEPAPMHDFRTDGHRRELAGLVGGLGA